MTYTLQINGEDGALSLVLLDKQEVSIGEVRVPYQQVKGQYVDNLLLTAVDNLFSSYKIPKSALRTVQVGAGIDKNSSLYRIVTSFAAAVHATNVAS